MEEEVSARISRGSADVQAIPNDRHGWFIHYKLLHRYEERQK